MTCYPENLECKAVDNEADRLELSNCCEDMFTISLACDGVDNLIDLTEAQGRAIRDWIDAWLVAAATELEDEDKP